MSRTLVDHAIFQRPELLQAWLYLLMSATWKPSEVWVEGKKITLSPGQVITSRARIASDLGITQSKVERLLRTLKTGQQIGQQGFASCRIISIINWDQYQNSEQPSEQLSDSHRTATGQPPDTLEEGKEGKEEVYTPKSKKSGKEPKPTYTHEGEKRFGRNVYLSEAQYTRALNYFTKNGLDSEDLDEAIGHLDRWFSKPGKKKEVWLRGDHSDTLIEWPLDKVVARKTGQERLRAQQNYAEEAELRIFQRTQQ